MPDERVVDLFDVEPRFLRSVNLERDFDDPRALAGYVVTDFVQDCVDRMAVGLTPESGVRAWRITGDYGSGKSSFALLWSHLLTRRMSALPDAVGRAIDLSALGSRRLRLAPVLVTCSRRSLTKSIAHGLACSLASLYGSGSKLKLLAEARRLADEAREPSDEHVIDLLRAINARIIVDSKAKGLLLILDELGKFLEFAALHPAHQDVYFLQQLAEVAMGSGRQPLLVVGLLHQGFNAYADQLSQSAQREWEKVAGRFEEIVFNQPIEQVAHLIGSALNVRTDKIPKHQTGHMKEAMAQALAMGWIGPGSKRDLTIGAPRIFPIHPTVLPVLVRVFRRFGQNERSLFSFLMSNEPFALQDFAAHTPRHSGFYCLDNLFDYVRTNLGHRLAAQSYRSHWSLIDSLVESYATGDPQQLRVLKAIGVLNLLNDGDLVPTEELVVLALAGQGHSSQKDIRDALNGLKTKKRSVYDRGRSRGLCLWPHTSVDLERAYEDARRAVDSPVALIDEIKRYLHTRPIVARRHYIETGNLRYFEVRYCSADGLPHAAQALGSADGVILVPLCVTLAEKEVATSFGRSPIFNDRSNWLVAVSEPLGSLSSLLLEVQRWEWISRNTLELNGDRFAREEVSRQMKAAQAQLERRIQSFVSFTRGTGDTTLQWFHKSSPLTIRNGRHLLSVLSDTLTKTFHLAPNVHNELLNRQNLSSAAAAARMRLVERMCLNATDEYLGMNPSKKPPEMSMYLSVLLNGHLHRRRGEDQWVIAEPHHKSDPANLLPAFRRIRDILRSQPDSRVKVSEILYRMREPPYGVREGLMPILLTVYAKSHEHETAIYKDGTFLSELRGEAIQLLTKAPDRFEFQHCKVAGPRTELFEKLLKLLEVARNDSVRSELVAVVRSLCVFVAELPQYALTTSRLEARTLAVRSAILKARDPVLLLFTELPSACDLEPIRALKRKSSARIETFVQRLRTALSDLRSAYPQLKDRISKEVAEALSLPRDLAVLRRILSERAQRLAVGVSEPKLKAFCLRAMDDGLTDAEWIESIGSLLALKPPTKWKDAEEDAFALELAHYSGRFLRAESVAFASGRADSGRRLQGFRIAITRSDGRERDEVLHVNEDDETRLDELQRALDALIDSDPRLGVAAASRVLWSRLGENGAKK